MELVKLELAEFKFKDVIFYIRTRGTISDKLYVDALMVEVLKSREIKSLPKIGRQLVKQFVNGWSGVTVEGKSVPYSYELMETGFPAEVTDELMPQLCQFVANNVDILKKGG